MPRRTLRVCTSDLQLDLQAQDAKRQMRALNALKDLTRSHRATHGMSTEAVQVAYREAGGFPLLLQLIDGCMTPLESQAPQPDLSIPAAAVDALSTLARNNAGNRSALHSHTCSQANATCKLCRFPMYTGTSLSLNCMHSLGHPCRGMSPQLHPKAIAKENGGLQGWLILLELFQSAHFR